MSSNDFISFKANFPFFYIIASLCDAVWLKSCSPILAMYNSSTAQKFRFSLRIVLVNRSKPFLKSDGVKSNDENMMKCNDRIPFHHRSENEGTCFLADFINKNIPIKTACLIKRASTLKCSEKQVLLKRIKAAINRCFLK